MPMNLTSKVFAALLLLAPLAQAADTKPDKKALQKKIPAKAEAMLLDLTDEPKPPVPAAPAMKAEVAPPPRFETVTEAKPEVAQEVAHAPDKHLLAAEVGLSGYNRSFDYFGARGAELRRYAMPFYPLVMARAEYFPLRSRADMWSQLAIEVAGNIAPWLRTQNPVGPGVIATFNARLDAGANVRYAPTARLPLTVIPSLALRYHAFSLGGTDVPSLPNALYLGVRVGAGAEYRFLEKFTGFTRLAVLPMFYSGEIISKSFFAGGSSVGLEATLGCAMQVKDLFEARLSFDYTNYLFRLKSNIVTDRYYATGAFDQYMGLSLSARRTF
jgi:hypothetical protein